MKSAVAAFLSVVLAIALGWGALAFLGSANRGGRDFTLIAAFAAVFLIGSGFTYGRWFLATYRSCAAGLAVYAILVWTLVAEGTGSATGSFFMDWFFFVLALTLGPWFVGLWAGKYARRFQLTP